jgi:dienelactone hydrolase
MNLVRFTRLNRISVIRAFQPPYVTHLVKVITAMLLIVPLGSYAQRQTDKPPCESSSSKVSVHLGARRVDVDVYTPTDGRAHPLIVMLHGSAGLFTRGRDQGPILDNFGEGYLSGRCFVVALPHYFEVLGAESLTSTQEMRVRFPVLLAGLQEALPQLELLPEVSHTGIGLYGESYGGFLAVALAATNADVVAVSEFGGGIPSGYGFTGKSASFLIQHGKTDDLVPIAEAYKLEEAIKQSGGRATVVVYPEDGHYFASASRKQVLQRSTQFFLATLSSGQ